MLNFKNLKSEMKAQHPGAITAAVERDHASNRVVGEWEAQSIAVMAQITAPLRLHRSSGRGLLG